MTTIRNVDPETEPYRMPPLLTELNRPFWTGGEHEALTIARCGDCRAFLHPPAPVCRACQSRKIGFEQVSGRGRWRASRSTGTAGAPPRPPSPTSSA